MFTFVVTPVKAALPPTAGVVQANAYDLLGHVVDLTAILPLLVDTGPQCPAGTVGKRVQAVYAYVQGQTNRYIETEGVIRDMTNQIDSRFEDSAQKTGGHRTVRWVQNSDCTTYVAGAVISHATATDDAFARMDKVRSELKNQGFYGDANRKYLVWIDRGQLGDAVACGGIGDRIEDDKPGLDNKNNSGPSLAIVPICTSDESGLAAHELMHTLGAVQESAPHYSSLGGGGHCSDGHDTMCLDSSWRCTNLDNVRLFDCGNDDYFYAGKPPAGSYLSNHWNTANSSFLINPAWPQ